MNGTVLNVTSTRGTARSTSYKDNPDGRVTFSGGYTHEIFNCLRQKYGFKFNFKLSKGFGLKFPNGSFTGVVGALLDGYDYAMEAGWNWDRFQVIDFLPACTFESLTFLTAIPHSQPQWDLVRRPFAPVTWLAVAITSMVLSIFLTFDLSFASSWSGENRFPSLNLVGIEIIGRSILEQSSGVVEHSTLQSLRILSAGWLLGLIVLGTLYKAKLTTLMAYPFMTSVPSDFEQLADSDYKVYLHDLGGLPEITFSSTTNPKLIHLRKRFIKEKSLFKCIAATISEHRTACITLGLNGAFEAVRNFSNIYGKVMVRKAPTKRFLFLPGGGVLRRGQPFFHQFSKTVHWMIDSGLVYKFQKNEDFKMKLRGSRWSKERVRFEEWRGPDEAEKGPVAINFHDVAGVVGVSGIFMVACSFLFGFEHVIFRWRQKSEMTRDINNARIFKTYNY